MVKDHGSICGYARNIHFRSLKESTHKTALKLPCISIQYKVLSGGMHSLMTGKDSMISSSLRKRSAMFTILRKFPGEGKVLSSLQGRGQDSMPEVFLTQGVINI